MAPNLLHILNYLGEFSRTRSRASNIKSTINRNTLIGVQLYALHYVRLVCVHCVKLYTSARTPTCDMSVHVAPSVLAKKLNKDMQKLINDLRAVCTTTAHCAICLFRGHLYASCNRSGFC